MRSRWALLFVVMHIAGFSDAATTQTLDQQRCLSPDPDVKISGCTAVIQSGRETQQNLAVAFNRRGNAYAAGKGQYDRAIEDYDQAIRLNPKLVEAFYNRGTAYLLVFKEFGIPLRWVGRQTRGGGRFALCSPADAFSWVGRLRCACAGSVRPAPVASSRRGSPLVRRLASATGGPAGRGVTAEAAAKVGSDV
jgi:hypothetical protein